jgi:hypothetical protein
MKQRRRQRCPIHDTVRTTALLTALGLCAWQKKMPQKNCKPRSWPPQQLQERCPQVHRAWRLQNLGASGSVRRFSSYSNTLPFLHGDLRTECMRPAHPAFWNPVCNLMSTVRVYQEHGGAIRHAQECQVHLKVTSVCNEKCVWRENEVSLLARKCIHVRVAKASTIE